MQRFFKASVSSIKFTYSYSGDFKTYVFLSSKFFILRASSSVKSKNYYASFLISSNITIITFDAFTKSLNILSTVKLQCRPNWEILSKSQLFNRAITHVAYVRKVYPSPTKENNLYQNFSYFNDYCLCLDEMNRAYSTNWGEEDCI
jgi:hypothetical protein